MTRKLIAVEGDTDTCGDAHSPPEGGGSYPISPVTLQTFFKINGKPVVLRGQPFQGHEPATAGTGSPCSSLFKVDGIPVCRAGDISQGPPHVFSGIAVTGQTFFFDNS
jgi:uncharacterized Zn-binding protein involved in type VI secretion